MWRVQRAWTRYLAVPVPAPSWIRRRSPAHHPVSPEVNQFVSYSSGRHFLQLPGPTNVPDRVLRAMARPTIDHRGPDFQEMTARLLAGLRWVFRTEQPVLIYPSSATGAWEAALVNTLSPGDRVLVFEQGFFATKWTAVAERLGLDVQKTEWDPRLGLTAEAVIDALGADTGRRIKAVLIVHNETSTGVTTDVAAIGAAVRASGHPALLLVDAVSSLGATDVRCDDWGLDITVSGSQKGLMLPPGLSFLAVGPRALEAKKTASLPCAYWDWDDQLAFNARGFFPYTPATNLLFGLEEALTMLREEGLVHAFERHRRFAEATRAAVAAWGLTSFAAEASEASSAVTAVEVPDGHDADQVRALILDRFDMSLGTGLGPWKGLLFRIGHLGHLNDVSLLATLAGVEMGLVLSGVPIQREGVAHAMDLLIS